MKFIPTRSALIHLRLPFSIFLLPVFLFALSQVPEINVYKVWFAFLAWHFFVYPASNAYNSYFDKDEGSIALIEKPPPVDRSLYYFSFFLDTIAMLLASMVSIEFLIAVIIYGVISKLYSHTLTRLKRYPFISFFIVFIFQGAFIYWTSYAAVSGLSLLYGWNTNFIVAGLICSCLIGANYPLTQIYQHEEDSKRGDTTLSMKLGIQGSFIFTIILFTLAILLSFWYWHNLNQINNFWLFLIFSFPVFIVFTKWFLKVRKNEKEANYKNMSVMTWTGGILMLLYFLSIWWLKY